MQAVSDVASRILKADAISVRPGCELLSSSLVVVDDMSDDLVGGYVERVMGAPIHGTCGLELGSELDWGTALVKPYMLLSDDGWVSSVRFNCGVYCLTTPDSPLGEDPPLFSVQGMDRLYLLGRPVGDTYYVDAGAEYLDAIQLVFDAAGVTGVNIDQAAAGKTLPVAKVWPLRSDGGDTTWLHIINELLAAISYRGVWADENGLYQCVPYVLAADRDPEFTFDTAGPKTIVGQKRVVTMDVWRIPNRWVFVQANRDPALPAPAEGFGLYTYDLPAEHPYSAANRGLVWPRLVDVDAADQASLQARAGVTVAADLRVSATVALKTGPFPAAGHADVFTYDDPELGPAQKVQAARWRYDLSGSDVDWVMELL